jgi:tRNA (uracil-5-)-methyltransferase TRM9
MAEELERQHVRNVYDDIAGHFSATRYKAWPVVDKFVRDRKRWSMGVDVGCGNGKNMLIRDDLHIIGFDLSIELLRICRSQGFDTVQGNMLSLPFRTESQEFAICIAALHHLASEERRKQAVQEMARILTTGSEVLIYVWALEQPPTSSLYRHQLQYLSDNKQDVLVPWKTGNETQLRYYHLFQQNELEMLLIGANLHPVYSGYDRDNWYVCARK